jgi:phosphoribosylglycinamide formyltransferase 1
LWTKNQMKPLILYTPRSFKNPLRIAVFVSGNGSNLQALIDASLTKVACFKIVLVVSNVKKAFALERANAAKIPVRTICQKDFQSRFDFEKELITQCFDYQVELVVLAGFMRVLSPHFLNHCHSRVINIHPALCPAFPGIHAARQALARGVHYTGCTVHLVNEGVDEGPILAQAVVPVLKTDNEETLQKRIQAQEYLLLPRVVRAIARGEVLFF